MEGLFGSKNRKWILTKKGWPMHWELMPQTTTHNDKQISHPKQTPFRIELIILVTNYMWIKTKNWKRTV